MTGLLVFICSVVFTFHLADAVPMCELVEHFSADQESGASLIQLAKHPVKKDMPWGKFVGTPPTAQSANESMAAPDEVHRRLALLFISYSRRQRSPPRSRPLRESTKELPQSHYASLWGIPVLFLVPATVVAVLLIVAIFSASSCFGSVARAQPEPETEPVSVGELEQSRALFLRGAVGLFIALAYIMASAAMILFNKHLMQENRFPFAPCLTSLHMVGALVLGSLLRQATPSLFPSFQTVFCGPDRTCWGLATALMPFLPIGIASAVALVAGNWAYRYATVTFLQMVKESHIVIVYSLSVALGLEALQLKSAGVLLFVACAATLAVYGETELSMSGLLLQLLAGFAGSTQIVLTNRMMAKSDAGRVDPMTMVLCMAPITLLTLAPTNFLFWDPRIPEKLIEWWPSLVISVLMAFVLQVTTAVAIHSLGGTGLSMASVAKDLSIVFSAALVLHESVTRVQMVGFLSSVVGIAVYSYMKLTASAGDKR